MEENHKLYLYPVWLRIWHGLNALLFVMLIITGISMQYASTESTSWLRFDQAVKIHNTCGIILTINYLFFILGNILSGNYKHYRISQKELRKRIMTQFRYDTVGIFKKQRPPFHVTKNEIQSITAIHLCSRYVYLCPGDFDYRFRPAVSIDTCRQSFWNTRSFLNDIFHVIMGYIGSMFMIIHVYFCTIRAKFYTNFKSIINSLHEAH